MAVNSRRLLPAFVYVVLVFVASSIPRLTAPGTQFLHKDKLIHCLEYFVLGVLLFIAVRWEVSRLRWATFGFLVAVASTIGALDEIYQSFIPGRVMSVYDWGADTIGAAVGVAIFVFTKLGGPRPAPLAQKPSFGSSGERER